MATATTTPITIPAMAPPDNDEPPPEPESAELVADDEDGVGDAVEVAVVDVELSYTSNALRSWDAFWFHGGSHAVPTTSELQSGSV